MEKITLPNGLTVVYYHKPGKAVVVEVMIKVGSNNESASERGITHFLEHVLFEGTTNRATNREISNEIEKIGGDFNAYTTNERTCFHVKVLQKHFPIAVEILADVLQNPLLRKEDIKKEKRVVLKEMDMVNDEPRFYQWILLQKHLFDRHPSKYPTYGDRKVIKGLTRDKILGYFKKYYYPQNMVISVVGDIINWKKEITQRFNVLSTSQKSKGVIVAEPITTKNSEHKEKRKIANTYLIMGFKTVPILHADAPALEVLNGIVGRGQSGRMFAEIRGKRGLAYDVGTQNVSEIGFGYFAAYASVDRKNSGIVKQLMLQELEKLKSVSELDLKEAKEYIEGNYYLSLEDSQKTADQVVFWEQAKDANLINEFIPLIKKVTPADIKRVVERYFKRYVFVMLEGK